MEGCVRRIVEVGCAIDKMIKQTKMSVAKKRHTYSIMSIYKTEEEGKCVFPSYDVRKKTKKLDKTKTKNELYRPCKKG